MKNNDRSLWIGIILVSLAVLISFAYFFFGDSDDVRKTDSASVQPVPFVDPVSQLSSEEIDSLVESDVMEDSFEESMILDDFSDGELSELEEDFF